MNTICEVQTRTNYGQTYFYPVNDTAKRFARMVDRKTLTPRDLHHIHMLGYALKDVTPGVDFTALLGGVT